MANYHYRCVECNNEFEISQSIKDAPLEHCQNCNCMDGLERVIHAPHLFIKGEPKTLGVLADRNTASMGRYELEDKREAHKQQGQSGRNQLPKAPRPWWRKTDKVNTDLAKYAGKTVVKDGKIVSAEPPTPEGMKYIIEGKMT